MPSAGYLRSTVAWYGGLGLLTGQVARNLALPPKYVRLVVQEIEVMGVRSAGVALIAASFTGMVLALQSGVNMARFGAETYVGPLVALSILRELGPLLTILADGVGLMGGAVIAVFERGVDWYAFWNTTLYWVTPRDFLTGITK